MDGPVFAFEDSRRLPGPSRWYAGPAVTLTALGPVADDPVAHARWTSRVAALGRALGWPDVQARVHRHLGGVLLQLAAPADQLFTATEVNEWAWEHSAAQASRPGAPLFDTAHPFDDDSAAPVFAARAQAEARPVWAALQRAADAHAVPLLLDDEAGSLGAGSGCRTWALDALPAPADVPWTALHAVPTALVTGSNGKTTCTRLLAAIAQSAGYAAGVCSTEGVVVAGQLLHSGDYAGPAGARAVLRHSGVQFAVLETARGGLLRCGLAVGRADVAVVTNVSPDHLGEYGIDSVADLAELKLVVARALVRPRAWTGADGDVPPGVLVLNADDPVLMAAAHRLPHARSATLALFAHTHAHPALQALRAAGGSTCGVAGDELLLCVAGAQHELGRVAQLPLALGGAARHNLHNAAAAALAAVALGLPVAAIAATLARFGAQPEDNPGRLERWLHHGATVLIDYAHNPDGLAQLLHVARALQPQRLGLLLGQAGNRDNAALAELAGAAARGQPDRVVIKELPQMLRGRGEGEVSALLLQGLLAQGMAPAQVVCEADEEAAAMQLLAWARPGDVLVLPIHTAAVRSRLRLHLRLH